MTNFPKYLFLYLILTFKFSQAQTDFKYNLEIGYYQSTNLKLPFWLQANQFGAAPSNPNVLITKQYLHSNPDSSSKKIKLSYGAELVTFTGKQTQVRIPEAYSQLNFKSLYIYVGRKKQNFGIGDSTLSSGSMIWSGNALPLPVIQAGMENYQKLFVNWLAFKGHIAHGWFHKQTYVWDYYLHQKSLFFRLGKPNSKVKLYSGILHNVQWGGTPKFNIDPNDGRLTNGKFPSDWFTFKNVFFPQKALVDTTLGYGNFEVENRFGAHLGQVDFGAEISAQNFNLLLYRQIPIETGRTIGSLSNLDDGIYGFSVKNKNENQFFEKIVCEYLYTLNQHSYQGLIARLLNIPKKEYMNDAFLFNHMQYIDGWTYNNRTIGSAFLIPQRELRPERSINDEYVFINNNRIRAFYLGLNGKINNVSITLKTSFSKNFGVISRPINPINQNSYLFLASFPIKKWGASINTSISLDQGDLIYDNYGTFISVKKSW